MAPTYHDPAERGYLRLFYRDWHPTCLGKFVTRALAWASGLGLTPQALLTKFLYVTNAFSSNLSAFTIDSSTGSLASITGSPFSAGGAPIALAVDPSANFLFVSRSDSTISGYRVRSNGDLSAITGSPFGPTGTEPRALAIVANLE